MRRCCIVVLLTLLAPLEALCEHIAQPVPLEGTCLVPVDKERWTEQEVFVWERVCVGQEADFNKAEGYGGNLDPRIPDAWRPNRVLRPAFLETILLSAKYRSALTRHGVHIVGSRFTDTLDLEKSDLRHDLRLERSLLEKGVNLSGATSTGTISFDGSNIAGELNLSRVKIKENLYLQGALLSKVNLDHARVEFRLSLIRAVATDSVDLGGAIIGEDLQLQRASFGYISLIGARIGGQLRAHGVAVFGIFDSELIDVRLGVYLKDGAEFKQAVSLSFAKMAILELANGIFHGNVDLTGAQISGELRLGSSVHKSAQWPGSPTLILRNARAEAIGDLSDAWPAKLDLNGFTYRSLGGIFASKSNTLANRSVEWFEGWLAKQDYAPAPYEQLASVLRSEGRPDAATDILYASKQNERAQALAQGQPLQYAWLTATKWFIGYGYHPERALYWVVGFIIAGIVTLRISGEGPKNHMPYGAAYSFDLLLPIIRLRKMHYRVDLEGWARYYFYFHKIMGYVLATFLIAGLAGLTK
jgi:uncharacterized protein YjbI with pentapeptide repeats